MGRGHRRRARSRSLNHPAYRIRAAAGMPRGDRAMGSAPAVHARGPRGGELWRLGRVAQDGLATGEATVEVGYSLGVPPGASSLSPTRPWLATSSTRGSGAIGSAPLLQGGGCGFESRLLHHCSTSGDLISGWPSDRADRSFPRVAFCEGALGNLVENAIRHHNSAEQIRVTTSRIRDEVQLRVIDAGPGIPLPAREHAFQPIQRQTDLGGDSVGLGLAVARGLTEAMGGTLTADDTPGGGLTMVVALPAGSST